jgi:hypothetical protein
MAQRLVLVVGTGQLDVTRDRAVAQRGQHAVLLDYADRLVDAGERSASRFVAGAWQNSPPRPGQGPDHFQQLVYGAATICCLAGQCHGR